MFEKYLALPSLTSSALSGALTTTLAISTWVAVPFIEKAGRRKWLITGACLQSIFLALVTGLASHPTYRTYTAAAAFMFAYVIVLGATWSPFIVSCPNVLMFFLLQHRLLTGKCCAIQIVYVSELMPLRFRHTGYCLSTSVFSLLSWLLVFAAPISYTRGESHGWTTWIWFLVFNVIAAPYGMEIPPILLHQFVITEC